MEHADLSNLSDRELTDYDLKEIWREAYIDNPGEVELEEYVKALSEYLLGKDTYSDDEAEEIKLLYSRHPNNEDVCELMSFYLTDQSYSMRKEDELLSVESVLSSIFDAFPNNTQIACDLASILSNLISVQDYDTALETVERVKLLKMRFPKEKEIKDECKSAENHVKQKKKTLKYRKAVEVAEMNYANNPCEKTAKILASSLSNLSDVIGTEYDAETIVSRIKELLDTFPSCATMWNSYANSLASLANCRSFEDAKETLRQLQELVNSKNSSEEMIEIYAEALSSKSIWNDHDISELLIELSRLYSMYPFNENIACSYASGLYCFADSYDIVTNKNKRIETIEKLHELATKHIDNKDIKEYYDEAVDSFNWDEEYQTIMGSDS